MAEGEERASRVTSLELFFDLVFVFTITQLTSVLVRAPTWRSLWHVVVMLGLIFWMYDGYAWLTNAVPARGNKRRGLLLGGAIGGVTEEAAWTAVFLYLWFGTRASPGFEIGPAHFVERHGLLVLIAIGESVVATGVGARGPRAIAVTLVLVVVLWRPCCWPSRSGRRCPARPRWP